MKGKMGEIYLVTGAAGHLGNTITRQLIRQGKRVRALVLPGDKAADRLPAEVEKFYGNLLEPESLKKFLDTGSDQIAAVIHCAGIVTTSSKFLPIIRNVNVTGTKNIVDLCKSFRIRKLVYISSVHAIPVLPAGETMAEVNHFSPETVVGPYAKSKAEATSYVQEAASNGLDASIVFPGGICGPYDFGKSHMTQLLIDFYQGRMQIGIEGGFDFVDVRDVAAGVISCCDKGKPGEGYILTNRYVSIPEMLDLFHQFTGKKQTKTYVPMWLAKAMVPFCEVYYRIRNQPPIFNAYSLHTISVNSIYSHEKAVRDLDYHVRPFSETVRDTVDWLKHEGRL
ncbi:nucleoside-diphosphate-sugar epimerase [Flexilinea flocculi]|jgi:dihydroflavonol-4-reductase|uniref:Nucleoside-diphosphate-sugar epimerase n=2 Tax=Flexilinea flocculi TaxID=1678840 RepID=A0A0S7BVF0_9CHLR|nr:nucleoside-diphosphate-sugar epimerase [Flexilinea flocculi]